MKIMKFGGTSVGTPKRMKALIPLINDSEKKIVVLSAMSGTTNSLIEISELFYAGSKDEALQKNEQLRKKYHKVIDELYSTENFKKSGHELIDSHFEYIGNFSLNTFTEIHEKAIVAHGELISTALVHLLLQEKNESVALLPALSFMRINENEEPDYLYIEKNLKSELAK
jgi:aspartate kinase